MMRRLLGPIVLACGLWAVLVGGPNRARAEESPREGKSAAGSTLQIPPVVERTGPNGESHTERGGTWIFEAPPRDGEHRASDGATRSTHQVVFLLDVSASMPKVHGDRFEEVVANVERRAREVLEPYRGTDLLEVSFYRFGDLRQTGGDWKPHVRPLQNGRDLSPDAALSRLDAFFADDPNTYDDDYTYVAASIHEAVRRELKLAASETTAPMPEEAPPLSVLAFTDTGSPELGGGESHAGDRAYEHEPYRRWLQTHRETHQLQYYYWNLETESYPALPGDSKTTYVARWPDAGRVDSFNLQAPMRDRSRALDIARQVTLVPALMSRSGGDGAIVCEERDRRERVDFPRRPIVLSMQGEPTYNVGAVDDYAAGRHPVRFPRHELCSQLTATYPDSEFRMPSRDGELQRLGYIEVVDEPRYTVSFGAEGTRVDAPLPTLRADGFHRYARERRTYAISAPEEDAPRIEVEWSAEVFRGGEPVADPSGFYAFETPGGSRDLSAMTSAGEAVTIELPGAEQRWWTFGRDFPFRSGDYTVEICARPKVVDTPDEEYALKVSCPSCRHPDDGAATVCTRSPLEVAERPLSWWSIFLLALASFAAGAITWRWFESPAFPFGTVVEVEGTARRTTLEPPPGHHAIARALHRFFQKPYYLAITNVQLDFTARPPSSPSDGSDDEDDYEQPRVCLALEASERGEGFKLWAYDRNRAIESIVCVRETDDSARERELRETHETHDEALEAGDFITVLLGDLRDDRRRFLVRIERTDEELDSITLECSASRVP